MTSRVDISPNLIHFTKSYDIEDAFHKLCSIIHSKTIFGSNHLIKGGDKCVCFSEAPINHLSGGLVNAHNNGRYSPFGIMVSKEWLFSQGGSPVIYQKEEEYEFLPDEIRWRHMTFNPLLDPPIDFTWEREWRIKVNELRINPEECSLIVPNKDWGESLVTQHDYAQEWMVEDYKRIIGRKAELLRDDFYWHMTYLG